MAKNKNKIRHKLNNCNETGRLGALSRNPLESNKYTHVIRSTQMLSFVKMSNLAMIVMISTCTFLSTRRTNYQSNYCFWINEKQNKHNSAIKFKNLLQLSTNTRTPQENRSTENINCTLCNTVQGLQLESGSICHIGTLN